MQTNSNVIDKNWKALIKPNKLEITSNEDKSIAKVIAEPLEKGFGQTIGNSLRRILLSSIQGAAVTAIQIDGVLHEFSSISGVREDVIDIALNIKKIIFGADFNGSKILTIEKTGPGVVVAGDISTTDDIEVMNSDLVLCTLDENISFRMELYIRNGNGYVSAEENRNEDDPIGMIPVCLLYTSPSPRDLSTSRMPSSA